MHFKYIFKNFLLILVLSILPFPVQGIDLDAEPIGYWDDSPNDALTRLQTQIQSGEATLSGETPQEVLKQVLDYLDIPIESQVLVYSKTSAQNSRIMPERPRAIYFSDNAYVGWVQGGGIEVLTFDPEKGGIFYFIDITSKGSLQEPVFERPMSCLNCHQRSVTGNAPGGLVRSVFPQYDGMPLFQAGTFYVGPETELKNRWGGWYVTGGSGDQAHMGNSLAKETAEGIILQPIPESGEAIDCLDDLIHTKPYLAGGTSDIVALMILEHQVAMHNTLNAANLNIRQLRHRTEEMLRSMGQPVPEQPEGTLKRVIESEAERIVKQLLFRNEHLMESDGVDGGEAFRTAFLRDRKPGQDGRSLKDLRLYERIFKYRCSYVIYSEVFDALPTILKKEVYRQLHAALNGPSGNSLSDHLSWTERDRIREILIHTKKDLPDYWHD